VIEDWDDMHKRMVHEHPVLVLRERPAGQKLTAPKISSVFRSVVEDDPAYVSLVVTCSGCMASIEKVELGGEASASYVPFSARHLVAAGSTMTPRIVEKHLDEVNIAAEMQAHDRMTDFMPAPVLVAIDNDRHGI
jgi:hypothetical protein